MRPRIAVAVLTAIVLGAGGADAACPAHAAKPSASKPHPKPGRCLDLNAIPQIGAQIVAREPAPPKPRGYEPPVDKRYEGPTISVIKPEPGVRPAPTVGYHWNLE